MITSFITGLITIFWFYTVLIFRFFIFISIPIFYPAYIKIKAMVWEPILIPLIFPLLANIKWVERAKIIFSIGGSEFQFDNQVSISGNTAVIAVEEKSAPESKFFRPIIYIYIRKENSWELQTKLFVAGTQVAINGNTIMVGQRFCVNEHQRYFPIQIFTCSDDTWSLQTQLTLPQPAKFNLSIKAIALKADTAVFLTHGKVYVFRNQPDTNNWNQEAEFNAYGRTVAIDGNTIIVGGGKSAYVFVRNSATNNWSQQAELSPMAEDDKSPNNVGIFGNTVVVGRPGIRNDRGAVDLYERDSETGEWFQQNRFFPSEVPWNIAYGFGGSVAIDNNTIVIGASRKHLICSDWVQLTKSETSAYIIERNSQTGKWSQPVKLLPKDHKQVARGYAREVRISGNRIIVTAPALSSNFGTDNIYIFELVDS
ncbi:hypothetical protein NIES267_19230 [Calothrix parasitica NIES-267]|uniref:Kelch repeat-containing protein n=1 Tax=Calothrix parasitica NIES-267 TaxID=1973488 RepID=A0A1Z4LMJ2_9CYAN|nr:hypothetical protein NIES267_19230 [Calothrix parasitica NIES-267]